MEAPLADRGSVPTVGVALPPVEELVERVPPAVRALLDELFRARFTAVRRFPGAAPGAPP